MDEKRGLENMSERRGCALGAIVPVASLLLLALRVIGLFVALASGGFGVPLPPAPDPGPAIAVAPLGGGIAAVGCISAAIVFGALVLAAAILFCCCRKSAQPDLAQLLRLMLEPFYLSLKLIQTTLDAILAAISAVTTLLMSVIATLAEVAATLRKLGLPAGTDAHGLPLPSSDDLASTLDLLGKKVEEGKQGLENVGAQVQQTSTDIGNAFGNAVRR